VKRTKHSGYEGKPNGKSGVKMVSQCVAGPVAQGYVSGSVANKRSILTGLNNSNVYGGGEMSNVPKNSGYKAKTNANSGVKAS